MKIVLLEDVKNIGRIGDIADVPNGYGRNFLIPRNELRANGGLEAMAAINRRKAATLYDAIETSDFYSNPIAPANRSLMNVPFVLADEALNDTFLGEAEAAGLLNLRGHRSVGGMRASLYNAVGQQAVEALVAFMGDFEQRHG